MSKKPNDFFINKWPPGGEMGDEPVMAYKFPVARKEHECFYCKQKIEKGEQYAITTYCVDGKPWSKKECCECYG